MRPMVYERSSENGGALYNLSENRGDWPALKTEWGHLGGVSGSGESRGVVRGKRVGSDRTWLCVYDCSSYASEIT
jgi:hypothetical protein